MTKKPAQRLLAAMIGLAFPLAASAQAAFTLISMLGTDMCGTVRCATFGNDGNGMWMLQTLLKNEPRIKVVDGSVKFIGTYMYQAGITSDDRIILSTGAFLKHKPGAITASGDLGTDAKWQPTPGATAVTTGGNLLVAGLLGLAANQTFNQNVLSFDFTVEDSEDNPLEVISTTFAFASEEWAETNAPGRYNDAFGFWLDGVNYAFLPGGKVVSVSNITDIGYLDGKDFGYRGRSQEYKINAKLDKTKKTHTLYIAIAETGSATTRDSAVFIGGPSGLIGGPSKAPAPAAFNAFEPSVPDTDIDGLIHTKLAGEPFKLTLVAIDNGKLADQYDYDVKVELVANTTPGKNYGANNCPAAYDVLQTPFPSTSPKTLTQGRAKNVEGFKSDIAAKDVRVRISYPADKPTIAACSTDSFAIRPASFNMETKGLDSLDIPKWNQTQHNATPVYRAGHTEFPLAATTTKGYNGTPRIDQAGIRMGSAHDTSSASLVGSFNQASDETVNKIDMSVARGSFRYSEVPGFWLAANAVYDKEFTAIDLSPDGLSDGCVRNDFSTTLNPDGLYGCAIGNKQTGWFGRFIPHHFEIKLTPACGPFTYSGQPFGQLKVTAMNGFDPPTATLNYSTASGIGTARDIKLYEAREATQPKLGEIKQTLSDGTLATIQATDSLAAKGIKFKGGSATASNIGFKFDEPLTQPTHITLRAVEIDYDTNNSDGVTSEGHEDSALIRSGRLQVFNAFGAAAQDIAMVMQTQYWTGALWRINTDDSCTQLEPGNFALSQNGEATTLTSVKAVNAIENGSGSVTLASTNGNTATINVALNLGSEGGDASCLAFSGGTGSEKEWLRSRFGTSGRCQILPGQTLPEDEIDIWERDPHGSVTFGNRTRRAIHAREIFR